MGSTTPGRAWRVGKSVRREARRASRRGVTFSMMLPAKARGGDPVGVGCQALEAEDDEVNEVASPSPSWRRTDWATRSPFCAQARTRVVRRETLGVGVALAYSISWSMEGRFQNSRMAGRRVVGSWLVSFSACLFCSSMARKVARRASEPMRWPEPWSARAGPQPPAVVMVPEGARPATLGRFGEDEDGRVGRGRRRRVRSRRRRGG